MDSSVFKKVVYGLKLGLISGILIGISRVILFLFRENYEFEEIRYILINLLYNSVNQVVFYAILFCFVLSLIWIFYHRIEGLVLAGIYTSILFLPVLFYINKRFLPGVFEPLSLLGNSLLLLLAVACTFLIFKRWTHNFVFITRICRNTIFWGTVFLFFVLIISFKFQPDHFQIQSVPPTPDKLIKLFERSEIEKCVSTNGLKKTHKTSSQLLNKYLEKKSLHLTQLIKKKLTGHDSANIIAHADSILMRKFRFVGIPRILPTQIAWRKNPTKDKVWIFALNRQEWIWDLAMAYYLTKDDKYALEFGKIIQDWFEQNPIIRWKNETDPVWRLMETSLRMTSSWIDAFAVIYPCDKISEKFKWQMLTSFHEHAQFLMHFRSPGRNHLLQETYGLMTVAGVFPEFKMAQHWLDIANLRLDRILKREIYPDGGYNEVSTFYHRFVLRILQQITDFATEHNVELSDYFYTALQKMYSFLMYVSKPDGMMPQINDGFHAKNLRKLYRQPAEMFSREDFKYFESGGTAGQVPEKRSIGFPYSGIYVMRSEWSENARYMLVDAGLFGSAHGHEDKLSFEISAFGKPLIVESGTFTYIYNRWHRYFESSFAHNTIVVDGKSQIRQPFQDRWATEPPVPLANVWHSNEIFDYLESKYSEGYGNKKENILKDVVHTRRIVFVKPDYWIILDLINGQGNHTVDQLFHFAPGMNLKFENDRDVVVSYPDGPELVIKTLKPENVRRSKYESSENPIQGWVSPKYGIKVSAPVVEYKVSGNLPQVFVDVLYPKQFLEKNIGMKAELLPIYVSNRALINSQAVALKVTSKHSTDYVLIAPGVRGEKQFAEFKTSAEFVLIRKFTDGRKVQERLDKIDSVQK